ncbi:efflux transporter [Epithele typhae]|uniref:efflux transporter n=1 Tax=Epithele typhae TaxID=378194 RepID=UPI0020086510|nr:efflux transporter [Epithele typhae]KAH9937920.1 efflux transporter [Epithele typhae]
MDRSPSPAPVLAVAIDEKKAALEHPHPSRSTLKNIVLIGTVTLAQILTIGNTTVVSIALPTIGKDLNIVESKLQWMVSAFALSSGCLLLFLGRAADLYGRKKAFILGCACMGIFGLGCGFAQDEITIDVLRALQGIGPAAAIPAALGILAHTFPPSHLRSIAFATFAAGAPVGGAVGNIIGGVLTQLTAQSWRSTFWFLTGLSFLCCVGAWFSIEPDEPYHSEDRRLDWIGAFLITAGLTFIIFVLSDGSIAPGGWSTPYIIAILVLGILLTGCFIVWEYFLDKIHSEPGSPRNRWWTPHPLMPLSIWARAHGKLAALFTIAFLEWSSFTLLTFYMQLYYQEYKGYSPILTMIRLIPMFVTGVLCNVFIALVVGRVPIVFLVVIGTAATAGASLLFALIDPNAIYWAFGFPAAIICVVGADFVFASGTLFVAKSCLPHEQSVGGAIFQTVVQLGTSFGLAISSVVFNTTLATKTAELDASGAGTPAEAQLAAYQGAFWTGVAFGLAGSLLAVLFLRGVGVVGHTETKEHADEETQSETTVHESS